ncbi:MAG: hypothetical protein BWY83_02595 [bacterium ADurb.Bin478]|nr:MAG: hypothetical protein BWY83_02595 [bacterium ADurb.Bin478]
MGILISENGDKFFFSQRFDKSAHGDSQGKGFDVFFRPRSSDIMIHQRIALFFDERTHGDAGVGDRSRQQFPVAKVAAHADCTAGRFFSGLDKFRRFKAHPLAQRCASGVRHQHKLDDRLAELNVGVARNAIPGLLRSLRKGVAQIFQSHFFTDGHDVKTKIPQSPSERQCPPPRQQVDHRGDEEDKQIF